MLFQNGTTLCMYVRAKLKSETLWRFRVRDIATFFMFCKRKKLYFISVLISLLKLPVCSYYFCSIYQAKFCTILIEMQMLSFYHKFKCRPIISAVSWRVKSNVASLNDCKCVLLMYNKACAQALSTFTAYSIHNALLWIFYFKFLLKDGFLNDCRMCWCIPKASPRTVCPNFHLIDTPLAATNHDQWA